MSVKSDIFGSVKLTGREAEKFVRQVQHGRVSPKAVDAAIRGRDAAAEFAQRGFATLSVKALPKQA